jgi:hypothetical protein
VLNNISVYPLVMLQWLRFSYSAARQTREAPHRRFAALSPVESFGPWYAGIVIEFLEKRHEKRQKRLLVGFAQHGAVRDFIAQ